MHGQILSTRLILAQEAEARLNSPPPNRKLISGLTVTIALTFVVVAVFGIVTYRHTVAVRQSEALVAHAYAVFETTRKLLSSVKDMETGQRVFLITGIPAYLRPYQAGLDKVHEDFAQLRMLTQNHPAQQRHLDKFRQLLEDKQLVLARAIKLRSADGETAQFGQGARVCRGRRRNRANG